jgi:large subunit ribosomal protein L18
MATRSNEARIRRRARVRRRLRGTDAVPRLCVFRSGRHTYAQVITDESGRTLAALSTMSKEFGAEAKAGTVGGAKRVGMLIAERLRGQGVERVVFDRNGFLYHGRVRAVAEGAREGGLQL